MVGGSTENYSYDDGDKLQSVSVGGVNVKTFVYDAAGRTTSVVTSAGTTTLSYDAEGRATSISGPGISQTNSYNGLDTRVSSVTNSVTNTFLRDGAYVTDHVVKDSNATYTPGISERRAGSTRLLSHNLKSVDTQSTTTPSVSAWKVYDAFGNVTSSAGTFLGPFGYGGGFGYQEEATGLKLLGHRLYDSSTGRFLTRDPITDGRNWYVYCDNDPIAFADPTGGFPMGLNGSQVGQVIDSVFGIPDRIGRGIHDFWHGKPTTDPEGYPAVVGGIGHWGFIKPPGNAITPNGVTYINDQDRDKYFSRPWWREHEHRHVHQREELTPGYPEVLKTARCVGVLIVQYALALGHDNASFEQDANRYADAKVGKQPRQADPAPDWWFH